jgi:hypothetical protein
LSVWIFFPRKSFPEIPALFIDKASSCHCQIFANGSATTFVRAFREPHTPLAAEQRQKVARGVRSREKITGLVKHLTQRRKDAKAQTKQSILLCGLCDLAPLREIAYFFTPSRAMGGKSRTST